MANDKQILNKDFFSTATRMTLKQFETFLVEVLLKTKPEDLAPIILWGAPGVAKSAIIEKVLGNTECGFTPVILSQVGPLDMNGLAHIEVDTHNGVSTEVTNFTPTKVLGRGRKHVFLDELNNAAPSTLAAAQNLLSAKMAGGDSFKDVHIIAACNPPSTNSLANDLNYPTISRCLNIVLDYTLDDFMNYAMSSGKIHPAIIAFHKKSSGRFLQAKWSIYPASQYAVGEPMANEPFPCPRSWTLASNAIRALSGVKVNNVVDYSLLKPLIEGAVGIQAASEFATTYAYMTRIPDIEKVFAGQLDAKKNKLEDNIAVQYLTMTACTNHCLAQINENANKKTVCRITDDKSEAYKLLAGIHHCVRFMGEASSPELATLTLQIASRALRESTLSGEYMSKLLQGVDPKKGLTRDDIVKYSRTSCNGQIDTQASIG
jgi:hypothetical protein